MLALVVLAGVAVMAARWTVGRGNSTRLDRALEAQPAVVVERPLAFAANPAPDVCEDRPTSAMAVEVDSGEIRWQQELPGISEHGNLLTVLSDGRGGQVALHVDVSADELPPSVMAIDAATGELLWQHYLAANWIDRFAVSESELVLQLHDPPDTTGEVVSRTVAIDAGGSLTDWFPVSGDLWQPQAEIALGSGYWFADVRGEFVDRVDGAAPPDQIEFGDPWHPVPVTVFDNLDGSSDLVDDLPMSPEFGFLGRRSSLAAEAMATDEHVLFVISSDQGPNTRHVLFDRASGEQLWAVDHLRAGALVPDAAAMADVVVYDKRNTVAEGDGPTRDLFVAPADDPENPTWSVPLLVNHEGGNGFLGVVDDGLVFAVADDDLGLRFEVIDGPDDVPGVMAAAPGYGSATGAWTYHLDDEVMAAVAQGGVVVQRPGLDPQLVPTDTPPNQVLRVDDVLLVNLWACQPQG